MTFSQAAKTGYEVLIVDNNSTDNTPEVAKRFVDSNRTLFRYVREPRQGLSFARNRGVAEARGEIVAFIDDDAVADADWLAQLWETYEQEPNAAAVGGKVVLQFPSAALPPWYDPRLDGYLSARDLPFGPARSPRDFPHGTNMSFRKCALQQVGGFHPLLGARRLGGIKLQGDETQLFLRLLNRGSLILFQPAARVVHVVEAQRLTPEYFRGLALTNGYVRVILENNGEIGVSTWRQLWRYVRRWVRRLREHGRSEQWLTEGERFWEQLTRRSDWGAIWYCLVARHQLRRLARRLKKVVPPPRHGES